MWKVSLKKPFRHDWIAKVCHAGFQTSPVLPHSCLVWTKPCWKSSFFSASPTLLFHNALNFKCCVWQQCNAGNSKWCSQTKKSLFESSHISRQIKHGGKIDFYLITDLLMGRRNKTPEMCLDQHRRGIWLRKKCYCEKVSWKWIIIIKPCE